MSKKKTVDDRDHPFTTIVINDRSWIDLTDSRSANEHSQRKEKEASAWRGYDQFTNKQRNLGQLEFQHLPRLSPARHSVSYFHLPNCLHHWLGHYFVYRWGSALDREATAGLGIERGLSWESNEGGERRSSVWVSARCFDCFGIGLRGDVCCRILLSFSIWTESEQFGVAAGGDQGTRRSDEFANSRCSCTSLAKLIDH